MRQSLIRLDFRVSAFGLPISRWYYLFLVAVIAGYGLYLFSFTVFDGFATFSNDAASYMLMARKWSPFFEPTPAEVFTSPVHAHPPGIALLLAVTGASESLWAGHLVVSLCMLAGLFLIGHYLGRQMDKLIAAVVTLAICLMPGIVIHTLGILSENLYIVCSLAALTVYLHVRNRQGLSSLWYLLLFTLLAAAVLTRTVGIALLTAFFVVPIVDRKLIPSQRVIFPIMALGGIVAWRVWEAIRPGESGLGYGLYLTDLLNSGGDSFAGLLAVLWQSVYFNLVKLLGSWSEYFALTSIAAPSFLLSYLLLMICTTGLILRAARLRLDAIYILFYLGIILIWPFPDEMTRSLHPIAILLLVQPVILLSERDYLKKKGIAYAVVGMGSILIAHSAFIHAGMLGMKKRAEPDFPQLAHSPEYYLATPENEGEELARFYVLITELMAGSVERIAEDSVVAAVKHDQYALLVDRRAVTLSGSVSLEQQLCNLKVKDVDMVFLSNLVTPLNRMGPTLYQPYEKFTSEVWPMATTDGSETAYIMQLDKSALAEELESSGYACERFRMVD